MTDSPFIPKVVLFGFGAWSQKSWFPILETLNRWGVIHLTVVEQKQIPPTELSQLTQAGLLSWDQCFESAAAQTWEVAFVITGASAQATVVNRLLKCQALKVIVCEKPCGESQQQAQAMFDACRQAGVQLLIADHYLLRPPVQHLLAYPELLRSIGELEYIGAVLNESQPTGPGQGATADLLVHLLDILFSFFPDAEFVPLTAFTAHAVEGAHTDDERV